MLFINEENNTVEPNKEDLYSSMVETHKHKCVVSKNVNIMVKELIDRGLVHDNSKLDSLESEGFAKYTKILAGLTYGSDEYKECLAKMKPFLDHHYANNRHHPEFHANGIKDMNLIDLLEMICDWKAATERHNDGNILKSIDINQSRFGYSDEVKQILINTVELFK